MSADEPLLTGQEPEDGGSYRDGGLLFASAGEDADISSALQSPLLMTRVGTAADLTLLTPASPGPHGVKEREELAQEEEQDISTFLRTEILEIFQISLPVALTTVCRLAIFTTDAAYVGNLGTNELGGMTLAQTCTLGVFTATQLLLLTPLLPCSCSHPILRFITSQACLFFSHPGCVFLVSILSLTPATHAPIFQYFCDQYLQTKIFCLP